MPEDPRVRPRTASSTTHSPRLRLPPIRAQRPRPRQSDITFKEFATIYLRDHADLHKKSAKRDRGILKTLNCFFGSAILHEITSHRIEQFKRDRLNGTWRAFRQKRAANRVKPATVNRELDTLKSILSKAAEWNHLVDSPARGVKRFRVQNRRTRILSADEQRRLLDACERMPKLEALLKLALITGARIGELLALRWEDCQDGYLTFWDTKNGKLRRIRITETIAALLVGRPRIHAWVFTNTKTERPYTTIRKVFERTLERAKVTTGDVTVHTLRHTALSRMIEHGLDDYTGVPCPNRGARSYMPGVIRPCGQSVGAPPGVEVLR